MTVSYLKSTELKVKIWSIFLVIFLLDIGGGFNIKDILFFLLVCFLLILLIFPPGIAFPFSRIAVDFVIFVFFPIIILSYSVFFKSVNITAAISQLTAFILIILLIYILQLEYRKNLVDSLNKILIILPLIVIITFLTIFMANLLGANNFIHGLNGMAVKYGLGYIGENPLGYSLGIFLPNVYYKWSILLIPISLFYFSSNKRNFMISFIASLLTLSTGIILFLTIGLLISVIFNFKFKSIPVVKIMLVIPIIFIMIFMLIKFNIFEIVLSKLSSSSHSTSVKLGHIQSVIDELSVSPEILLFGMGIGTEFYSKGINQFVTNIEVSHFNVIRQFGLIYFLCFSFYIISIFIRSIKLNRLSRDMGIGLLMLFICAGTNPLLISPVFFIWVFICKGNLLLKEVGD